MRVCVYAIVHCAGFATNRKTCLVFHLHRCRHMKIFIRPMEMENGIGLLRMKATVPVTYTLGMARNGFISRPDIVERLEWMWEENCACGIVTK